MKPRNNSPKQQSRFGIPAMPPDIFLLLFMVMMLVISVEWRRTQQLQREVAKAGQKLREYAEQKGLKVPKELSSLMKKREKVTIKLASNGSMSTLNKAPVTSKVVGGKAVTLVLPLGKVPGLGWGETLGTISGACARLKQLGALDVSYQKVNK